MSKETGGSSSGSGTDRIVGQSPAIHAVFDLVDRIADTPATVLVSGESGTGKELIARELHARSRRRDKAFVSINCTAIPANLLEAELFGYERGAFTDAKIRKKGLLEIADGGTLFLDEIGLMPLDLQAKILTVLEDHTFRRVGGTQYIHSDIRIIAATNENLQAAVVESRFRRDLFYRLNVVPVRLPPLRDRGNDTLLIARYFLDIYSRRYQRASGGLSQSAERWLLNHSWPGNVRELRNVIERATLLGRGESIEAEDLALGTEEPDYRRDERPPAFEIDANGDIRITLPAWGIALDDVERRLIEEALREAEENVTRAAQLLHISRDTLRYRMKKFGMDLQSGA